MKATTIILLTVFLLVTGGLVRASQDGVLETDGRYYSFQPCSSWVYDFDVRGYICNFKASYVQVPSASEVGGLQNVVTALQDKVQELEERIQQLENP